MTLQSTINNSAYYHSDKDNTESDPNINSKVATHTSDQKKRKVTDTDTTNGNSPHKSLINWLIPEIIPVIIPQIDQTSVDGVAESGWNFHTRRTILSEENIMDTVRSAVHVFWTPADVSRHDTDRTTPHDSNTDIRSNMLT